VEFIVENFEFLKLFEEKLFRLHKDGRPEVVCFWVLMKPTTRNNNNPSFFKSCKNIRNNFENEPLRQ